MDKENEDLAELEVETPKRMVAMSTRYLSKTHQSQRIRELLEIKIVGHLA